MTVCLDLLVKKGPCKGQVLSLDGRRSVSIGRAPGNTLVLADEKVSSHHARIDMAAAGVILTDLGSKNGTFAGGESVVGSRLILPGIEVALGGTVLELAQREVTTVAAESRRMTDGATTDSPTGPRHPRP